MGLFDKIFGNRKERQGAYQTFKMLTGYAPVFKSWGGEIYESELVRAAIDARARHISKLEIAVTGTAKPDLQAKLRVGPNEFQTWGQFLYRLSTILDCQTTAIIVPVIDKDGKTTGIFPVLPEREEIVQYLGKPFLRMKFKDHTAAIELDRVGIMSKYQYRNDFFGEGNHALKPTMELVHVQNKGIEEGVKSSASFRFMATSKNWSNDADLAKERDRFVQSSFNGGDGGVLLWPNTVTDVKQINSTPFVVDADQMKVIRNNVFDYFGVNEDVLQNKSYGDSWSAFYEGAIEPFAIQLSDVLTKMFFTVRERELGTKVTATANRLQYMSNQDKLNVSSQMLDRGILSINDVRTIWNMPPVDGGDVRIIRGEYYSADEKVAAAAEGESNGQRD